MTDFSPLDTFRDPVGEPDPARSSRIRDEFRARIATMAPDDEGRRPFDPAPNPSPRSWTRPRQPVLALAALGLVLLLAGIGAVVLSPSAPSGSLDELALTAATRSDTYLQDGQYLYLSERTVAHGSTSQRDQWTANNGTGQAVDRAALDRAAIVRSTERHAVSRARKSRLRRDVLRTVALTANRAGCVARSPRRTRRREQRTARRAGRGPGASARPPGDST